MNSNYEEQFRVHIVDTDLFGLCKPSSILNFLQETAGGHAQVLRIGRDDIVKEQHGIWMLVRLQYTLNRPIRTNETLTIKTWYCAPKGVFVQRDFEISVDGVCVGHAWSTWVIGNEETHALMKAEEFLSGVGASDPALFTKKLGKIRMPKEMQDAGCRQAAYSETDINGHINNIRYADYACDTIHLEKLQNQYVCEMQITYSAECLAGERVHMQCTEDGKTYYVRGVDKDGKSHFDIRMELAEIC